jgi:phospholipid/cholesterol/gamma-HCH transport system substrate-binding protein
MKTFAERNPLILCVVGVALTVGVALAALNYSKLPFVNQNQHYSAYFAEAAGLVPGAPVQVSGYRVGQVEGVDLDGARVLVRFNVAADIPLGDRTEAAIQTKSLLGAKIVEVTPRGSRHQDGPIPLDRTRSPYQLPDALGDLTATISDLNTDQLSKSLQVLSDTFKDTPPDVKAAVEGVGRFSQVLNERDGALRNLLANANKTTAVLSERSDEVVSLVADSNALLIQLQSQSNALDQISTSISAATRQLKGFINENNATFKPALDKLNGVLAIVDNHKQQVQESIKKLNAYAMSLGESVASGPFFKAYLVNLLPGQFVQPFVDAAFSDLGLDPAVLAPSQRTDPQVGQPGTPALPVPFPRTGQGGDPNLNLPDAITGKPGDPRYPYREPPAAPPPGGPPPGPPAVAPPGLQSTPSPTPSPVYVPAPGEVPASTTPGGGQ